VVGGITDISIGAVGIGLETILTTVSVVTVETVARGVIDARGQRVAHTFVAFISGGTIGIAERLTESPAFPIAHIALIPVTDRIILGGTGNDRLTTIVEWIAIVPFRTTIGIERIAISRAVEIDAHVAVT
jgi:hypothetical protein